MTPLQATDLKGVKTMNKNIVLSGFSDEACSDFEEQLQFVSSLGIHSIEIRGVDGKNISQLTEDEVQTVKEKLNKYSVAVSSIGSPIGKINITDDFEPHFQEFKRVVETAKILGTENIRMFSFYIPKDSAPELFRAEVLKRLSVLIDYAKKNNMVLLHENEKGIYGDNAERCLDLMKELYCPNFKAVFDFANFVQVGQNTLEAAELMKPYVSYIHIKDASGEDVVPPGFGEGNLRKILGDFIESGYKGYLSLEPHLSDFDGFKGLEQDTPQKEKDNNGKFWWKIALCSLKSILYDINEVK